MSDMCFLRFQVYIMCGVYTASALVGFATIALLLDTIVLDKDDKKERGSRKLSPHLFLETLKHVWKNHYQKLLIPLTMYSGIEQAFIAGDFTRVRKQSNDILYVR